MHQSVQNLINIESKIKLNLANLQNKDLPRIIAVSKTFSIEHILPLINYGHMNFGENKVQEAIEKWTDLKVKNVDLTHWGYYKNCKHIFKQIEKHNQFMYAKA